MFIDIPQYRLRYRRLQTQAADFGLNPSSFNRLCGDYLRAREQPETPENWVSAATEALEDLYLENQYLENLDGPSVSRHTNSWWIKPTEGVLA